MPKLLASAAPPLLPEEERRLFILLRYVLIIAAAYLFFFEGEGPPPAPVIVLIAGALASNVVISQFQEWLPLGPATIGIVVCADVTWIVSGLLSRGSFGSDIFVLYFFVLLLAATGENLLLTMAAGVLLSAVDLAVLVMPGGEKSPWTSPALVRIPFIFTAAVFYGHLADKVRRERRHALMENEFSERLARVVHAQTRDLREQAEELRVNYEQALEASRVKAEFVATVSHELRTPLQAIMSYIEALLDGAMGALRSDEKDALERMRENGLYLLGIITSILHLNRLEAGKAPVHWEEVEIEQLLRDVERMAGQVPSRGDVVVQFHAAPGIPRIVSDADKLRMILRNLVENAMKFTAKGRVELRAGFIPASQKVEFSVSDTGPGIGKDDLPLVFDIFWQKGKSHTRPMAGVGLGLYIVKRFVADLMGEIDVECGEGGGSVFRVRVPLRPHSAGRGEQI